MYDHTGPRGRVLLDCSRFLWLSDPECQCFGKFSHAAFTVAVARCDGGIAGDDRQPGISTQRDVRSTARFRSRERHGHELQLRNA
jgi:hypothetical protein